MNKSQMITMIGTADRYHYIDDSLIPQFYVIGAKAMNSMGKASVFVSGLSGLGVEIGTKLFVLSQDFQPKTSSWLVQRESFCMILLMPAWQISVHSTIWMQTPSARIGLCAAPRN
jgi:hypothetical protein